MRKSAFKWPWLDYFLLDGFLNKRKITDQPTSKEIMPKLSKGNKPKAPGITVTCKGNQLVTKLA